MSLAEDQEYSNIRRNKMCQPFNPTNETNIRHYHHGNYHIYISIPNISLQQSTNIKIKNETLNKINIDIVSQVYDSLARYLVRWANTTPEGNLVVHALTCSDTSSLLYTRRGQA